MGKLTTQVLDTVRGQPAHGVKISLYRIDDDGLEPISTTTSSVQGKTELPLLEGEDFVSGRYQLVFSTATYFVNANTPVASIPFLDDIVVRFGIANHNQDFHLPLMISPYGYSICKA